MKLKGLLHYPQWVQPKTLIVGDISYRRKTEDSEWKKYIWTGKEWRLYDFVTYALQKKSELRQGLHMQNKLQRTKGII